MEFSNQLTTTINSARRQPAYFTFLSSRPAGADRRETACLIVFPEEQANLTVKVAERFLPSFGMTRRSGFSQIMKSERLGCELKTDHGPASYPACEEFLRGGRDTLERNRFNHAFQQPPWEMLLDRLPR
jgi:hypothetical protein